MAYSSTVAHRKWPFTRPELFQAWIYHCYPHPQVSIVESLCDREVACSASDRQGSNFESCVCRTVSSHSFHHPQEVLLAQFSLYVHKGGLKPDSFHLYRHPQCRNCRLVVNQDDKRQMGDKLNKKDIVIIKTVAGIVCYKTHMFRKLTL